MACVAALAGTSVPAAVTSSASVPRSAVGSSSPVSLFRRRSFNGGAARLTSRRAETRRLQPFLIRGASSEETTPDVTKQVDELLSDLKAKWDSVEDKSPLAIYGGGALVALWLSSTIVGAINAVPLLPKVMELVGLAYTGWFIYRYLLFKSSRAELAVDIKELKSKITGVKDEIQG